MSGINCRGAVLYRNCFLPTALRPVPPSAVAVAPAGVGEVGEGGEDEEAPGEGEGAVECGGGGCVMTDRKIAIFAGASRVAVDDLYFGMNEESGGIFQLVRRG